MPKTRRPPNTTTTPPTAQTPPQHPLLPATLTNPSSQTRIHLLHSLRLLHLLHTRNTNQHRRALWFHQFCFFRREVVKFCADIGITVFGDELVKEGGSNIGGGKDGSGSAAVLGKRKRGSGRTGGESGFTGVRVNEASARLNYWVSAGLIPKWYTAITSLTATPSFTPLSLTLLSLFTRLLHLTHALPIFTAHASFLRNTRQLLAAEEAEKKEREEEDEVVRVLEAFGREMVAEQVEEVGIRVERGGGGGGVVGEGWGGSLGRGDGEKVSRERRGEGGAGVGIMQDSKMTETTAPQAPQPQPPKKKKKKKPANAIDALFAGL